MNVEIEIIKGIPVDQINDFENKTIYNCAVFTREYTKSESAFPYLTGELQRSEIAEPIIGSNKEYGLTSGIDYAKYVWNMNNANWTNKNTQSKWYYSVFNKNGATIISQAVSTALKGV